MNLQIKMSEKDKKTLFFLGIFVIVVCFGYWGVYPQIKAMKQIKQDIQTQQDAKFLNDMKLGQLPMMQSDNEILKGQAAEARKDYYPWMTNDEIDKMMTGMVLNYQLNAYDLSISGDDSTASLDAYQYAAVPPEMLEDELGDDESESMGPIETGIRQVDLGMRLGGEKEQLQKFIDEISESDQSIWIRSYSWTESYEPMVLEDGTYEYISTYSLSVALTLYMCIPETQMQ